MPIDFSVGHGLVRALRRFQSNAWGGVISEGDLGFTSPSFKSQVIYELTLNGLVKQGNWAIENCNPMKAQILCPNPLSHEVTLDFSDLYLKEIKTQKIRRQSTLPRRKPLLYNRAFQQKK